MYINHATINEIIFNQFQEYASEIEKIEMGVMTFKYKVTVKNIHYILRIYPPENTTRVDLEFKIMQQLFIGRCKVPEPVAYNDTATTRYLFYKFIEGVPLLNLLPSLDTTTITAVAMQLLQNILCFSKKEVQGFGFLLTAEGPRSSWQIFLLDALDRGTRYLSAIEELDQTTIDVLLDFVQKKISLVHIEKNCLVWSDFSPGNIIINHNHLAGFVDFEGCVSGDPLMALGYLFAIEGHSYFFEAVMTGYKKYFSVSYEQVIFYTLIRLFRLSKYFTHSFPTGISRDPLLAYFKGVPIAIDYIKAL